MVKQAYIYNVYFELLGNPDFDLINKGSFTGACIVIAQNAEEAMQKAKAAFPDAGLITSIHETSGGTPRKSFIVL